VLFNSEPLKRAEIQKLFPDLPARSLDRLLKEAVKNGQLVDLGCGKY
jgi:hypothetical protein